MKISYPYIFFLLFTSTLYAQVTFVIDNLPKKTSKNAKIYISGNFEGWTGGQEKYKLFQKGNSYSITLPKREGILNFKFTQGSWETVETDIKGNSLENRTFTFGNKSDTVKIKIANWKDVFSKKSTATKNVSILSENFYMPQLDRKRKIRIYLPLDYSTSNKSYPVMYMHDGQNLFDDKTSYAGEWEVDETLNKLYKEKGFGLIVIGIDNGGEKRMDEYSPWKIDKYGGGEGDAYVDFIIKTLKPYVDDKYRTKSDSNNTTIMGSSMGGLISYYAGLKHPEIFGKIGVFSPSFWLSDESFSYAKTHANIQNEKMFFLVGDKEGDNMINDMERVISLMKNNNFLSNNIFQKVVPNGQHNEKLWRDHFEEAVLWLFDEQIN